MYAHRCLIFIYLSAVTWHGLKVDLTNGSGLSSAYLTWRPQVWNGKLICVAFDMQSVDTREVAVEEFPGQVLMLEEAAEEVESEMTTGK